MHFSELVPGTQLWPSFYASPAQLFQQLEQETEWDTRMFSRKTASFGKAYNYSQITYPEQAFPATLASLLPAIEEVVGYCPNNCLINFYPEGSSRMGYHSDQVDILAPETGIGILSLGAERPLRFRNITSPELHHDVLLPSGSLFHMSAKVQQHWQHALPKAKGATSRMSLTFRRLQ